MWILSIASSLVGLLVLSLALPPASFSKLPSQRASKLRRAITAPLRALKWVVIHDDKAMYLEVTGPDGVQTYKNGKLVKECAASHEESQMLCRLGQLIQDMYLSDLSNDDQFFRRTEQLHEICKEWSHAKGERNTTLLRKLIPSGTQTRSK